MKYFIAFLLFATSVAWTQPRRMNDNDPPNHKMGMMERLKLNDTQRDQVQRLHSDLEKKQIALRSRVQTLRIDVRDAFREDKPDRGKIESKINEISKAQSEMKLNHLAFWFDVNRLLTPEQQKIWKERPMMGGLGVRHPMRGPMRHMQMETRDDD